MKRKQKIRPGVPIVPGMRVMDTTDSRENITGVCIATDDSYVVFRVDGGPMEPGSLNVVEWNLVAICPEKPDDMQSQGLFDAQPWVEALTHPRIARRLAWFAEHIGYLPPYMLLLSAINVWDGLAEQQKNEAIIDILDMELHEQFGANNAPSPAEGGAA